MCVDDVCRIVRNFNHPSCVISEAKVPLVSENGNVCDERKYMHRFTRPAHI
jgi:hypothetical protein